MSSINDSQKDNASKFMSAMWVELMKPYYNAENTDEWWGTALAKANELAERYCKHDRKLLCMVTGYMNGLHDDARGTT